MVKLDMDTPLQLEQETKMTDIYFSKEGEYYFTDWKEIERFPFADRLDRTQGSPAHKTFAGGMMMNIRETKGSSYVFHPATHKFHERYFAIFLHCLLDGYHHVHQRMKREIRKKKLKEE